MRFGVNLRGDLAKLSDQELGDRLDATISERETPSRWPGLFGVGRPHRNGMTGWRGPFHGRIFYTANILALRVAGVASGSCIPTRADAKAYLLDCEIQDLLDEVKRRLEVRKRSPEERS